MKETVLIVAHFSWLSPIVNSFKEAYFIVDRAKTSADAIKKMEQNVGIDLIVLFQGFPYFFEEFLKLYASKEIRTQLISVLLTQYSSVPTEIRSLLDENAGLQLENYSLELPPEQREGIIDEVKEFLKFGKKEQNTTRFI